ncbi:MAG: NAD-dependent dehydratase [Chloroflexi bacterium RBG_16_57_11]|nr:MAG: NAD-dependent dehydratase [Chloroflexi bacterium RBG_16_57_11]
MATSNDMQVIFGTGPLGLSVMRELVRQGKRVRMVNGRGKADLPAGVELIASDAYLVENTRRVTEGAAVVYQCAQPRYHEWAEKFPALQASILEGAAANGAKLVIGENLYMYGEVDGPIHEGRPYNATTRKGKTRAQMAEAALTAHRDGKLKVTIGRGSDFFGPQVLDSSLGERVFAPALQGKTASATGSLDLPHTYTYIDDFGKALVSLGEDEEALGRAWHVPNAEPLTQRQLITMIFDEIGRSPRMSGMGKFMLRIGGLFIPEARETVEMMYEFEKPFIVDDSQYKRTFGDHATPLRDAIRATVAWYRQHLQADTA